MLDRSAAALVLGAALWPIEVSAQSAADHCGEDAMIVFDGSGSMSKVGSSAEPRIVIARRAVRVAVPEIAKGRRLGLVVYGSGEDGNCASVDLRFPPQPDAAERIIDEVEALEPAGDTPLTAAVEEATEALQGRGGTVLLVTDGKETCRQRPCELAARLARLAPNVTVHVVGFEVRSSFFSWDAHYGAGPGEARCLADATGGRYIEAETAEELADAIRDALGCRHIALIAPSRARSVALGREPWASRSRPRRRARAGTR